MPIRNIVNVRIEELRKARGLSQTEFAVALGMEEKKGRSTVNNWEQSLVQVKSDDLIRIAKAFSVSADYLLGLSDAATDDKGLQFVCDYLGLSAGAVETLRKTVNQDNDIYSKIASEYISEYLPGVLDALEAIYRGFISGDKRFIFNFRDNEITYRDIAVGLYLYERFVRDIPRKLFNIDGLQQMNTEEG